MNRAFQYQFDEITGVYRGLVREKPFPENSTPIEPPFQIGCKTVFDRAGGYWKLVERGNYFEQVEVNQKIADIDLETVKCLEKLSFKLEGVSGEIDVIGDEILLVQNLIRDLHHRVVKMELKQEAVNARLIGALEVIDGNTADVYKRQPRRL